MKLLYLDSHKKFSLRRNRPERGLRHGWWMAFVTRDEAIFFFTRNGDLNDIIPENGEIDFTRKRKTKERAGVWISLKITSKKFQFLPVSFQIWLNLNLASIWFPLSGDFWNSNMLSRTTYMLLGEVKSTKDGRYKTWLVWLQLVYV